MQNTLGVTEETSNIYRLLRARTKSETKDFQEEFAKALKIVLDSLEGSQKVFYQIVPNMANHTVTIRMGSTLGIGDLPVEVQKMIAEDEAKLRLKEDGDGTNVVERVFEETIPPKPTKSLRERIHEIEQARPQPNPDSDCKKDGE